MKEYIYYALFALFGGLIVFVILYPHKAPPQPTTIERVKIITHRSPITYRLSNEITFCDERVPLEKRNVWERLDQEFLLAIGNTPQVMLWLKRSNRYFPYIENKLAEKGLPVDLKYLAVIESDLIQDVRSPVGAAGPWQFMKATARKMGLRVNHIIDERYDFYRSTDAAIKYLRRLNRCFDNWTLSVAAYNLGMTRIRSEMRKQKINDYYYLVLPNETERYLFRAIAAKLILSEPEKFGFSLEKDQYYDPIPHDIVDLKIKRTTSLKAVAQASETYLRVLKELNPQIRRLYLPRGHYRIKVPKGKSSVFEDNFQKLARTIPTPAIYVVRKGDNLTKIARRHNVSLSRLIKLNRIRKAGTIYPGQRLIIGQGA
ncbi:MAG: transglycosylase SLT domain-containing protein [Syntrophobacterales bacterium]|nr:MAG: transglycosylase SLT domain-containing protein [Syntrophobacterales bacterium]